MPKVTVTPVNTINVKVNQHEPQVVHGTTTFVGATSAQDQIDQISIIANTALSISYSA